MLCVGFNAGIGEHTNALTKPETQMVVVIKVYVSAPGALGFKLALLYSACLRKKLCGCFGQNIHPHALCKYPYLILRNRTSNVDISVTNISR